MSIDRHAAERRRFARLLGIDGELGSGLPIGGASERAVETKPGERHVPENRRETGKARVREAIVQPSDETSKSRLERGDEALRS
ncbi:hypothetical protein AB7C87_20430 [Natrarchaeobius sp. A-rgal3]|uniref:hypothetical protein n=1 Tax=Natrarchaeobius versutus TaxID=1679078 RepID=UPI00350FCFEA